MRILMLAQSYPPIQGGEEQYVQRLSAELAARGHHVTVATLAVEGTAAREIDNAVRVYRMPGSIRHLSFLLQSPERPFAPPLPDPEAAVALRRILAVERPQIVHAHDWLAYTFLPLKAWSTARLVVTLHNYGLACATTTLMRRGAPCAGPGVAKCLACVTDAHYGVWKGVPIVLGNWALAALERGAADMFLPVSRAVAQGSDLDGRDLPYRVIPNFLSAEPSAAPQDFAPYLEQLPEVPYLLYVGALGRFKGVDVLLRAYSALASPPPLVLIGYATPEVVALPASDPDHRVFVLREWPHQAVMEAWRRSLLALVPSVWPDPCPTVALEAMAAGRPVVGTRIGGLPDLVVDGETGILVPPDDVAALERAMARLLGEPPLRERLGAAAQGRSAAFTARRIVPQIEDVYRTVLDHHAMRPEEEPCGVATPS